MSKRWLATLLIGLGLFSLLPFLPQVLAFARAEVDLSAAGTTVGGTPLISCRVPSTVQVDNNLTSVSALASCVNNYGGPLTVQWAGAASGSSFTLNDNDPDPTCRPITFSYTIPGNGNNRPGSAVLTAVATTADGNFRAEVQFVATLNGQNNPKSTGGGCP